MPSNLMIQHAETEMAVSRQWTHAQLVGHDERVLIIGFGLFGLRGGAPSRDLTEEPQGIRLVAPFLVLLGERQGALGEDMRFLQAASQCTANAPLVAPYVSRWATVEAVGKLSKPKGGMRPLTSRLIIVRIDC
jgi:hypothetical protein